MRTISSFLLTCFVVLALSALPVLAQEMDDGEAAEPVSAFSNPAQAAKAEGLAAAATEMAEQELADAEVERAEALAAYDAAVAVGDPAAIEAASANLAAANDAYAEAFAGAAGVTTQEVADMRAAGLGWGDIAHALGVHPSVIGKSVANRNRGLNPGLSKDVTTAKSAYSGPN